jgi:hypothetical protein
MENDALKERYMFDLHKIMSLFNNSEYVCIHHSQQEINDYYGIQPRKPIHPLFKLRSCVYALIALQRFSKSNQ